MSCQINLRPSGANSWQVRVYYDILYTDYYDTLFYLEQLLKGSL